MNTIQELLADAPKQELEDYEAYLKAHLKLMMTGVSKARVQDISHISRRKNRCIEQCYKKELSKAEGTNWIEHAEEVVEGIRQCKQKCGKEKKDVKKYLDDINYYSSLKLSSCMSDCQGDKTSKEYNICYWGCLNRLDRRYKKYWVEQRKKLESWESGL